VGAQLAGHGQVVAAGVEYQSHGLHGTRYEEFTHKDSTLGITTILKDDSIVSCAIPGFLLI